MKAASTSGESGRERESRKLVFPALLALGVGALGYWLYGQQVGGPAAGAKVEVPVPGMAAASAGAAGTTPVMLAATRLSKGGNELVGSWRNVQRIDAKQRVLTWETEIAFEANGRYRTKQVINGNTTIRHTGTWRREGDRVTYNRTDCKWEGSDLGREACPPAPTPPTKIVVQGDSLDLSVEKPDAPVHKFQRVTS